MTASGGRWVFLLSVRGAFAAVARRLRGRPDSEHEMSLNRLAFAILIAAYVATDHSEAATLTSRLYLAWVLLAACLFLHILVRPGVCQARRAVALCVDIGFLSAFLHVEGEPAAMFIPAYFWVICGNGFRFGIRWMLASVAAALLGFGAVAISDPFWTGQIHLTFGLVAGLLVLPLYAGTLIRKLSHAKRLAEQANGAKTLFLASVSHELRTPLNAIIGMGSVLKDTTLDDEQREMATTIDGAARSLLGLINGILDFSRIEAGHVLKQPVPFDLVDLLTDIRRLVGVSAREKGLRLSVHLSGRVPALLRGDRKHLQEIILNLAGNAVKFTEAGSVVIAADAVWVSGGRVRLRFEVTDTGIGIAAEARARIFERFTQADATITSRFGGTGLGLAICQRLVQLHGGEIGVESEPGKGSSFWFTLDLESQGGQEAAPATSFAGATAIILGEMPEAVASRLASLGIASVTAISAEQALAQMTAAATEGRDTRRRAVFLNLDAHGAAAAAIVRALRPTYPPRDFAIVAVSTAEGLPIPEIRGATVATISPTGIATSWEAALRLAGLSREAAAPVAPTSAAQRRLRIVVADDNRVNRTVLSMILGRAGHETIEAENGEEALDILERDHVDLVLMDINMPVLDGLEATKLYRFASLGQQRVPIIGLTADVSLEAAEGCRLAGMDGCLTKPVEPERLVEMVRASVPPASSETSPKQGRDAARLVSDITAHPRYRAAPTPVIDSQVLANLHALGGKQFVAGLVEDFLCDAAEIARHLDLASVAGDTRAFRLHAHAMRSIAVNVGALALIEACEAWQEIGPDGLITRGDRLAENLAAGLERTRHALRVWLASLDRTGS